MASAHRQMRPHICRRKRASPDATPHNPTSPDASAHRHRHGCRGGASSPRYCNAVMRDGGASAPHRRGQRRLVPGMRSRRHWHSDTTTGPYRHACWCRAAMRDGGMRSPQRWWAPRQALPRRRHRGGGGGGAASPLPRRERRSSNHARTVLRLRPSRVQISEMRPLSGREVPLRKIVSRVACCALLSFLPRAARLRSLISAPLPGAHVQAGLQRRDLIRHTQRHHCRVLTCRQSKSSPQPLPLCRPHAHIKPTAVCMRAGETPTLIRLVLAHRLLSGLLLLLCEHLPPLRCSFFCGLPCGGEVLPDGGCQRAPPLEVGDHLFSCQLSVPG